ncbi:MAG: hypothetical protein AAFX99_28895, partial [Myxococcota bacterium]
MKIAIHHTLQQPTRMGMLIWVTFLSAVALGAGCVAPGEFDDVDRDCSGNRFDAVSRDAYCSGTWSSRSVSVDGLTRDDAVSRPLVHVQDGWLTMVQKLDSTQINLQIFQKDSAGRYLPLLNRSLELPSDAVGDLTSAVMMGLSDGRPVEQSVLALVQDRRDLMMLNINEGTFGNTGEADDDGESGRANVLFRETDISRLLDVQLDTDDDAAAQMNCSGDELVAERQFADLAAFTPEKRYEDENRQYVVIAAGCATIVYGYEPSLLPSPTQLVQLPTEAVDI